MTAFRFMWRVKRHRNEKLAYAQLYLMCKAKVYANSFLQYKSKKVPKNRDFSLACDYEIDEWFRKINRVNAIIAKFLTILKLQPNRATLRSDLTQAMR